jgi:hypothetical protein
MTDPVLALILVVVFFLALTLASWFKTLDSMLWREARVPLTLGLVCGVALRFVEGPVAIGVLLTLAALYTRLTGRESEPADGMSLGAMTGGAAAVPLVIDNDAGTLLRFAACILAGAVAGYGITFGLTHVRRRLRQLGVDVATGLLAVGAAALPGFAARSGLADRQVALAAAALVPLLIVVAVFQQWPAIKRELRDEARLGVLDDEDVRPTAHPFLRLGRSGWHDANAHREFVRIASTIALRKRQQRGRPEEVARLYQLEVIKLRMDLQSMTRIDRAMRAQSEARQAAG